MLPGGQGFRAAAERVQRDLEGDAAEQRRGLLEAR